MAFVRFFDYPHGRLDLELVPKLLYFSTVPRVFALVVLLPPSTADVVCPLVVNTDEPWRFRTMSNFSVVSFPPRLMRLVTTWMLSALFRFVFCEELPLFFVGVEFSSSLGVLPFSCGAVLASWRTSFHN